MTEHPALFTVGPLTTTLGFLAHNATPIKFGGVFANPFRP
jgi:hypothetical protein